MGKNLQIVGKIVCSWFILKFDSKRLCRITSKINGRNPLVCGRKDTCTQFTLKWLCFMDIKMKNFYQIYSRDRLQGHLLDMSLFIKNEIQRLPGPLQTLPIKLVEVNTTCRNYALCSVQRTRGITHTTLRRHKGI